ncbi:MAG: hypothetical protein ACO1N9_04420 [Flavobacterium sp.]
MKICLISFDFWEYDKYIIKTLQDKGHEAVHINFGSYKYKYPTPLHRVGNFLSKVVLKKNIKKIKQRQFIVDELKKLGRQDKILVINPESIPLEIHNIIKPYAGEYIAYLYDSSKRCKIDHLLDGLFDRIFSFDRDDVAQYGFLPITNYIYFDKQPPKQEGFKYKVFVIMGIDDRLPLLNKIADAFDRTGVKYKFIIVGKHRPETLNPNIHYQKDIIRFPELKNYLAESEIFLDLIREYQDGLSFRVFDALGYQRKLITTNKTIALYNFYNPENILILDKDNLQFPADFFEKPYQPLPDDVYHQYTLDAWTDAVFGLK